MRALALLAVLVLAGCTRSAPAPAPTITERITSTSTTHVSPHPMFTPERATTVAPLPPGARPLEGEREHTCPYIRAGLSAEPTGKPNVADLEGDHVYRITLLTGFTPVGCRFYFYAGAYEAVADIQPHTFRSARAARDAMILTAEAGAGAQTVRGFVPGLTGIRYRTEFYGPDGTRDWAFVFAKGRRMIVVHTQQTNASLNAQGIAAAIAGKF